MTLLSLDESWGPPKRVAGVLLFWLLYFGTANVFLFDWLAGLDVERSGRNRPYFAWLVDLWMMPAFLLQAPSGCFLSIFKLSRWDTHLRALALTPLSTIIYTVPTLWSWGWWRAFLKKRPSRGSRTCHNCGYDLRGSPPRGACPECGAERRPNPT
jgi:hypothetical protein